MYPGSPCDTCHTMCSAEKMEEYYWRLSGVTVVRVRRLSRKIIFCDVALPEVSLLACLPPRLSVRPFVDFPSLIEYSEKDGATQPRVFPESRVSLFTALPSGPRAPQPQCDCAHQRPGLAPLHAARWHPERRAECGGGPQAPGAEPGGHEDSRQAGEGGANSEPGRKVRAAAAGEGDAGSETPSSRWG